MNCYPCVDCGVPVRRPPALLLRFAAQASGWIDLDRCGAVPVFLARILELALSATRAAFLLRPFSLLQDAAMSLHAVFHAFLALREDLVGKGDVSLPETNGAVSTSSRGIQ
jgi:hypothetical protein